VSGEPFAARFRETRQKKKLTQVMVADLLEVSQSAVAQWEAGRSHPSEGMAKRIKRLLGVEYLASDREAFVADSPGRRPSLPVIGAITPGDDDRTIVDDLPHGDIPVPPQLEHVPGAKAVYVRGRSMEPRYFAGEVVYLHPRPPNPGDFVFIVLSEPGFATKVGYVRQYVGQDIVSIKVSTLNPKKETPIDRQQVVEMATIVGSGLF
jgi:transcriptional regulator with XRE-family HTH domain